jgi:HEAT repeat protein
MSTSGDRPADPIPAELPSAKTTSARAAASLKAVVTVVVCGVGLFWAGYALLSSQHPVWAAARGLRSSQPSARVEAVRKVTEVGMTTAWEAIPPLLEALKDSDEVVRTEAARSICLVGEYGIRTGSAGELMPATASALFEALKDQSPSVRTEAIGSLTILCTSRPASSSRGPKKAEGGAATFKSSVEPERLGQVLIVMLDDSKIETRLAAMRALGAISFKGKGSPPKGLIMALEDRDPDTRTAAISSLATFGHDLEPLVLSFIKGLGATEPEQVRAASQRALETIEPSAISAKSVPVFAAALKNPDRDIRLIVLSVLARLSREVQIAALPLFIEGLKEPADTDQRRQTPTAVLFVGPAYVSAQALGKTAPGTGLADQAVTGLTVFAEKGSRERGVAAAAALSGFGPKAAAAVPVLAKLLENIAAENAAGREVNAVTTALARIAVGTPSAAAAIRALGKALASASDTTREAAVKALEQFGPQSAPGTLPQLRALQEKETSPKVRAALESALKSLAVPAK